MPFGNRAVAGRECRLAIVQWRVIVARSLCLVLIVMSCPVVTAYSRCLPLYMRVASKTLFHRFCRMPAPGIYTQYCTCTLYGAALNYIHSSTLAYRIMCYETTLDTDSTFRYNVYLGMNQKTDHRFCRMPAPGIYTQYCTCTLYGAVLNYIHSSTLAYQIMCYEGTLDIDAVHLDTICIWVHMVLISCRNMASKASLTNQTTEAH